MLVEKDQKIHDLETQLQERKQADEEARNFRTIADQSNFGTAIASLEGTLIYVNGALANMHGWHPDELIESQERLNLAQEIAQMGSYDFEVSTGKVR